ncbi:MAG TPA: cupin domain-containing protein [Solirubrobacteraceae bacterium]|jgi:mannose-6-phosphate isomerase-like protein (cupin superfamily)
MANFTHINLVEDVEDMAPKFGLEGFESRFARKPLELEKSGVGLYRVEPNHRFPFGHTHAEQEEVYVVLQGSARFNVDGEIVELRAYDALRVPGPVPRAFESGPEGAEILAFGAPYTDNKDAEMLPGWWEG